MFKKATVAVAAAILFIFAFSPGKEGPQIAAGVVFAQDNWKTEFETICSRTQEAGVMSPDELKNLIERCDKLRPQLENLEETQRKVYLKRLKLCRDLYAFALESKENR